MNLESILSARPLVAVLGDLMLDEWIFGSAGRISPEAPVPVVRFNSRRTAPGGAANVAMNLLSLGAPVRLGGVLGVDEAASDLKRELLDAGAEISSIITDQTRFTTLKTRVMAQRQQLVRIDRESAEPLDFQIVENLVACFDSLLNGAQALCLSDYDKGIAASGALETALQRARGRMIVTGGPKPRNLNCFAGADFLSLNESEAVEAVGEKLSDETAISGAGEILRERFSCRALAITRGGAGVSLFVDNQKPQHLPALEVEVFDVAGAGDTFLSAATLALAAGADFREAAETGNLAAACSVRHVGVVAVAPDELRSQIL